MDFTAIVSYRYFRRILVPDAACNKRVCLSEAFPPATVSQVSGLFLAPSFSRNVKPSV